MTPNLATGAHSAAAAALQFLFAANRSAGLPQRVCGVVDTDAGLETAQRQAFIFTPFDYEQTLQTLPPDAHVELSPIAVPDGEDSLYEVPYGNDCQSEPDNRYQSAVLIRQFEVPSWVVQYDIVNRLQGLGYWVATWGLVNDRGQPVDNNAFGVTIGLAFANGISMQQYDRAGRALFDLVGDGISSICPTVYDPHPINHYRFYPAGSRIKALLGKAESDDEGSRFYPADLIVAAKRWKASGRNPEMFERLGRRRDSKQGAEHLEFLVEGLIPCGMVTLLAGAPETGKSTVATELAVAIATDTDAPARWLGQPLNAERAKGVVVLLTGEDTEAMIRERRSILDPEDEAWRLVVYAQDDRPLRDICDEIAEMPNVSLIIVDPARRYLKGDEDSSDNVNTFLEVLEQLAKRTGAAVLVIHHLTKNAAPKTVKQVLHLMRGSAVFKDRPRVILGMLQTGDSTKVGVAKHNMPPSISMMADSAFERDPATLRHGRVSGSAIGQNTAYSAPLEDKVFDAIRRQTAAGQRVHRTGKHELYQLGDKALAGIGRDPIRKAVKNLIESGLLINGDGGLYVSDC